MAIQQPIGTDPLNSPSHSKLHRVIASDSAASDQALVVDASDNVGIGTTTPIYRADIVDASSGGAVSMRVRNNTLTDGSEATLALTVSPNSSFISGSIKSERTSDETSGSADLIFSTFGNSLTEKMRIDSGGDVGIGTTSPLDNIHVKGSGRVGITIETDTNGGGDSAMLTLETLNAGWVFDADDGSDLFRFSNISSGDEIMRLQNSRIATLFEGSAATGGTFGIGVSNPAYRLELEGSVSSGYFGVSDVANGDIFEINTVGKVGIANASPAHRLDVYTNADNEYIARFDQDHATGWGVLIDTDGTLVGDPALHVKNASTDGLYVGSDMSVGIGTTTPAEALEVNNTIVFTSEYDNGNSSTADTIDFGNGNKQKSTLTGNVTYTFTAPGSVGNFLLVLVQDATGSRTATWPATVKWPGGTAPTLSTGNGEIDIVSFYYDGTNYYGQAGLNFS
jgi:hypothetical protein|tara:strand:+ start:910 stop:2265 length:1356 start_codon:yes stop_codon:yes gene_type:complete